MEIKLNAEISVKGRDIKKIEDAVEALNVMLGCYDDMDSTDTTIKISVKTQQ